GGARREDHGAAGLQDVAPQVRDPRQQLQVIDAAWLPSLSGLDVNRRAVPGDLHFAGDRRKDDLLGDPGDDAAAPAAAAAGPFLDHLVELDDGVALPIGDDGPRLGADGGDLGWGG